MSDFNKNMYLGVFGIADYEFETQNLKYKMADSIWRIQYGGQEIV